MNRCEHIQAALLDYLYEVLDPAPAHDLEAHLIACPACQQALVRARGQQELLASATRVPCPTVRFDAPPPPTAAPLPPPASRAWWRPSMARWAVAAAILVALGGLSFWSADRYQRQLAALDRQEEHWHHMRQLQDEWADQYSKRRRLVQGYSGKAKDLLNRLTEQRQASRRKIETDLLSRPLRLQVTGPEKLEPGAVNTYQVQVNDRQERPLPARIDAQVVDASGRVYYRVSSSSRDGTERVVLPRDLPLEPNRRLSLVVHASAAPGQVGEVQESLDLNTPLYATYLTTDKPLYGPGEIVRFSSLTLERFHLTPPQQALHLIYSLTTPQHDTVEIGQGRDEVIHSDGHDVTWPSGQTVHGVGGGEYKLDSAAPEGTYTLAVRDTDRRFPPQERTFRVQRTLSQGATAPLKRGLLKKLHIEFFPEGGELVAGALNRVYFRAGSDANQPVNVRGHIVDDWGQTVVPEVSTLHDATHAEANRGMGLFGLTPEPGRTYELKIDAPTGIEGRYRLPAVQANGVVLMAEDNVTPVGQPIRVTIHSVGRSYQVFLGAYCRGHLMAAERLTVRQGVKTPVLLRPKDDVGGVYRITLFEIESSKDSHSHLRPMAERLVFRRPTRSVKLTVQPEKSSYAPGDHVRIKVRAERENGVPVPAMVTLSVMDRNVLQQAHQKTFRTMPAQFLLASEVRRPEDLEHADFFLGDSPLAERALDLLLGTQGWRRFAEQDPAKFRQAYPHDADQLLVWMGQLTPAHQPRTFHFDRERILALHAQFNQQTQRIERELALDRERLAKLDHQYADIRVAIADQVNRVHRSYLLALGRVNRSRDLVNRVLNALIGLFALALLAAGVVGLWAGMRRWQTFLATRYLVGGAAALIVLCALTSALWVRWQSEPLLADVSDRMGREMSLAMAAEQSQTGTQVALAVPHDGDAAGASNREPRAVPMVQSSRVVSPPPTVGKTGSDVGDVGGPAHATGAGRERFGSRVATPSLVPANGGTPKKARHPLMASPIAHPPARVNGPRGPVHDEALELATLLRRPPVPAPPMVIRPYAHVHYRDGIGGKSGPDRTDTLYWDPVLVLQHGQGVIEFDLNDSATSFQIQLHGITPDGRVGASTAELTSGKSSPAAPGEHSPRSGATAP